MIDYGLLDESINYYTENGFIRIESPWLVTEYIDLITKPKDTISYRIEAKNKNFVASGEQSFLYLYLKEYLPKGKFQTITPCLRNDSFDFTHTKYFMKNELIITDDVNKSNLDDIIGCARDFFTKKFNKVIEIIPDGDGYDLQIDGYELGSYGIRECEFLKWIYGTGCAEPRTSKLLTKYGIS